MKGLPGWQRWLQAITEPATSPALDALLKYRRQQLPVLWLMGKTGAGKSSIIQRLTGDSRAQIGNGFEPCTRTAMLYEHPADTPVLRFLDTRGLGETNYDPEDDLQMAQNGSHALLVITRVDDPAQETLLHALKLLKTSGKQLAVLQVHTALHTLDAEHLQRAILHNTQKVQEAIGRKTASVQIDFTDPEDGFDDPDTGLPELCDATIGLVPEPSQVLAREPDDSHENTLFSSVRKEILGYAGTSAAVDLFPAVGLVAVPAIQGKMLHTLAARYGLTWTRQMTSEFVAAMGASFLYRYLIMLGTRQLSKMIPVYGQSAGAAAAASISFSTTYALGRAACLYFYRRTHNEPIDSELLRKAFTNAFKEQRRR